MPSGERAQTGLAEKDVPADGSLETLLVEGVKYSTLHLTNRHEYACSVTCHGGGPYSGIAISSIISVVRI